MATDLFDIEERMALARFAVETNDFAEALRLLKTVLGIDDGPAQGFALAALTYQHLRLLDRAEACYQRYLDKHPQSLFERFQLGVVQAQSGRQTEALLAWDRVLGEQPDFFPALFHKGMALLDGGKAGEAKHAFEAVLRAAPAENPYFARARDFLRTLETERVAEASQRKTGAGAPLAGQPVIPESYRAR